MKQTLRTILFALVAIMLPLALWAQEASRIYLSVGTLDNLSAVPLGLYLDAPTSGVTAVEVRLTLPEGATMQAGTLAEACAGTHALVEGTVEGRHFVSIASSELAALPTSGTPVCTWLCDFSKLAVGNHSILATGLFAVGVTDGTVTTYTTDDQEEHFTVTDLNTAIATPSAPSQGTLRVYTLGGRRLDAPQRGEVNIVNGRKVRF